MNVIELENVSKSFGRGRKRVSAVNSVSFSVNEGEAFGFIGANGAGKSTTIKMIMDIIRVDSGDIRLLGRESSDPNSRRGVAYVPENAYLYDYLTPMELLRIGLMQHGVRPNDPKDHCMGWLEKFGIAAAANKRIRSLSKGMTQRAALAHALACQPRLLILDEPLSGLDPVGRKDVVDILSDYRRSGGTIFFTSHVLYDVEAVADRFCLIAHGRVALIKSAIDVVKESPELVIEVSGDAGELDGWQKQLGDRWTKRVPKQNIWPLLKAVESRGLHLLSVKPSLNLETVFMEYR